MGNEKSANPIIVVQGAQWGSEAKGAVAAALCRYRNVEYAIRTGTVNAGHTVLYKGRPYKMQQLPTAWAVEGQGWPLAQLKHKSKAKLIIGPGAYIHPEILAREIFLINEALGEDIRERLFIDYRCGLHLPFHTIRSSESGRHHKMGATGKGCSEAVIDKIRNRGIEPMLFVRWLNTFGKRQLLSDETAWPGRELLQDVTICDTAQMVNDAWDQGARLLIEGTQGTQLDLHLGPYPYTTHKQTQVGNWMAEAGLSPSLPVEVALVARTFPIRVAGNSGPMPGEIRWPELAREINARLASMDRDPYVSEESLQAFERACLDVGARWWRSGRCTHNGEDGWEALWQIEHWSPAHREECPEYVSELHREALAECSDAVRLELSKLFEMTTVTNKLRRIARLNPEELRYSLMLNRPAYLVLTFINYMLPEVWDKDWDGMTEVTRNTIENSMSYLSEEFGTEIRYVSTGAATEHVLEVNG